jgi:hypothetical protein
MKQRSLGGGLGAAVALLCLSPSAAAVDISLDPSQKYQTIVGWETMLRGWEVDKINDRYDPTWLEQAPGILDRMVNELGINRVRLEFRSGYENPVDYYTPFRAGSISYTEMKTHWYEKINDNADPNDADPSGFQFTEFDFLVDNEVLPLKQLVEANGEKLYINLCYVDFNSTNNPGTLEHALDPDEYAELTQVFFDHLADKYGLTPDGLEIILEPELTNEWRGKQIGDAIVTTVDRLRAAGYDPDVSAPTTTSQLQALPYFDDILAVPGAVERMTTLSYHRYALGEPAQIYAAAQQHGLMTAMLEHTEGEVGGFLEELVQGNVSAWQKFGIAVTTASNDISYYRADFTDPENPVVTLSPTTTLLAPYFRFVRRGAQRVGAQSSDLSNHRPVAFVNANGSYVVVVRSTSSGTLDVSGLPAGKYGVRHATTSGGLADDADVTVTAATPVSVTAPAGVTAIYDKRALDGGGGSSGSGGSSGRGGSSGSGGATASGGSGGDANGLGGEAGAETNAGSGGRALGGAGNGGSAGSGSSGAAGATGSSSGGVGSGAAGQGGRGAPTAASVREGGGCSCRVGVSPARTGGWSLLALGLALSALRRRWGADRRAGSSRRPTGLGAAPRAD